MINVMPGLLISLLLLAMLGSLHLGGKKAAAVDAPRQSLADYGRGLRALFRNRSLVLLSTSGAFRSMTQNALLTFLPLFLAREMGYCTIPASARRCSRCRRPACWRRRWPGICRTDSAGAA